MKEIELKQSTVNRINDLQSKADQISAVINDMLLTVLEHEEIDISKHNISYENGFIILNEKK